jgi:hypothetical protein
MTCPLYVFVGDQGSITKAGNTQSVDVSQK